MGFISAIILSNSCAKDPKSGGMCSQIEAKTIEKYQFFSLTDPSGRLEPWLNSLVRCWRQNEATRNKPNHWFQCFETVHLYVKRIADSSTKSVQWSSNQFFFVSEIPRQLWDSRMRRIFNRELIFSKSMDIVSSSIVEDPSRTWARIASSTPCSYRLAMTNLRSLANLFGQSVSVNTHLRHLFVGFCWWRLYFKAENATFNLHVLP